MSAQIKIKNFKEKSSYGTEEFILIPHVRILGGKVVLLNFHPEWNATNAEAFFKDMSKGFSTVLISDIDGIMGNRPQLDVLQNIEKESDFQEIWVDGGVRISDNVIDLFIAGASRVILSTKTLYSLEEIKESMKLSQNLVFHIGSQESGRSQYSKIGNMPASELVKKAKRFGVDSFILDEEVLTEETIRNRNGWEFFVAVRDKAQGTLKKVRELGARGAIIDTEKLTEKKKDREIEVLL